MWNSRPSRSLHGKIHLKFPFWLFDYLPGLREIGRGILLISTVFSPCWFPLCFSISSDPGSHVSPIFAALLASVQDMVFDYINIGRWGGAALLCCNVLISDPLFAHFVGRQINPELLSWGHRLTQNRRPYLWQERKQPHTREPCFV